MAKDNSFFLRRVFLGQSRNGNSIFSRGHRKGEKIIEFTGKILDYDEIKTHSYEDEHCLQIGPRIYMGLSGNIDDFINHSCEPNSGIKKITGKYFLIAVKDIKNNEEITWDYSTWVQEPLWKMKCYCGSKNCRGIIRSFRYLSEDIKRKYIKLGVVANYILANAN